MPELVKQFTYANLALGQKAEFHFMLNAVAIANFAKLSGDENPLHADASYAATTEFGRPVAHGMIAGMLFSRLVGMELPGKYCVYLSQQLRFHHPMFPDDDLLVKGEVIGKSDAFKTLTIATTINDSTSGKLLVDGEALVRVLQ